MLLAKGRRSATLDVIGRVFFAGVMRATFAEDVHHAVISVLPAIHWCLPALDVIGRLSRA